MTTASTSDHSGWTWARGANQDNAWDDLILTLDGGGIRGYSSLLILKQLMHEVAECEKRLAEEEGPVPNSKRSEFNEDNLLPCHYFDYMYGTSTGGLISVMLGRLRMTVPQCLEVYREVGNDLFGRRRSILPLATKYHHKPLEHAVQRTVKKYCKHHEDKCTGKDWHPWNVDEEEGTSSSSIDDPTPQPERICQTICLTATHSGRISEAYLLRTYDHRYDADIAPDWITPYNQGADKLRIWQVTRATSAAPFFFKMLEAELNGKPVGFKDGGIRENNPSYAAYSEHASMRGEDVAPALLLSVGTGRPDQSKDGFAVAEEQAGFASAWPWAFGTSKLMKKWAEKFAVFKNVLIKYTEGEQKHRTMQAIAKGEYRWYKRLNVSTGLENMKLDNWEKGEWLNPNGEKKIVPGGKTLTLMESVTNTYLTREKEGREYAAPKVMLKQTAERLVRHRRLREATKDMDDASTRRWETYMGCRLTGELKDEDGPVDR